MQKLNRERDETLAERGQRGDTAAIEELLNRYKNMVRARARGFFLIGGETEDLVQEGMVGLYTAARDFKAESGKSFKNFAYLCVTRRILDAVRASSRKAPTGGYVSLDEPDYILSEEQSPEEFLISSESTKEFKIKLMRELSDYEFRVVPMYLEG
ncbi:MAG: sigma-70 family RNA polymerase sigma factor, partial [Clostridiales bacterium]|nr:sigma-70 family RNA polymerase sigma factor [Clostridiales bacterium]